MSTKFKLSDKKVTNALYIGAALLIIAAICVSVFALASKSRKNKHLPNTTTGATGTVSEQPLDTSASIVTEKTPESTSPVTKDVISTNIDTPKEVSYKGPIESGYVTKGHDCDTLVYSLTMNDYRVHSGIDISAEVGAPVYSCAEGEIKQVWKDALMGTCISVTHSDGMISYYKNLSEILPEGIAEGVKVKQGQLIGSVGESAIIEQSDSSHLHFEMTKDAKAVDPLDYVVYSDKPADKEAE